MELELLTEITIVYERDGLGLFSLRHNCRDHGDHQTENEQPRNFPTRKKETRNFKTWDNVPQIRYERATTNLDPLQTEQ